MKKTILTLSSVLGLTFMAHGQATTAAVGYNTVTCPVNSDTIVSVPFLNTSDSISTTVSGAPSGTTYTTFTLANVSGLTTDQYADMYYVRFTSGQLEGEIFQITGNSATTVTIDTLDGSGATTTKIEDGNKFTIYKFWTLDTLFPPSTQNTIIPAPSSLLALSQTKLMLPPVNADGVNNPPSRTFYILSGQWREFGSPDNAGDTLLWPDTYFVIRHSSNAPEATTYRPSGQVDSTNFVIPLRSRAGGSQDNYVAIPRPIAVKVKDLGLTTSGDNKSFEARDSTFDTKYDRILVFDNNAALINKAASATYFYDATDSRWEKFGIDADAGDDLIQPSAGLIIRKASTTTDETVFWKNNPTY
ncbi:hypothetical protein Rhal01_00696 [Rubritalea halochordaticola]|uniref:TIGR02597 family protein n=1 Tax=Rubritalea halochordaticola TaxID=714537 RepID=A0ABP9UVN4_9BACT